MPRDAETRDVHERGTILFRSTDLSEAVAFTVAWKERGYSASGIAKRIDSTEGTVDKRLDRAVAQYGLEAAWPTVEEERGELTEVEELLDLSPARQCTMPTCETEALDPTAHGSLCAEHYEQATGDSHEDATVTDEQQFAHSSETATRPSSTNGSITFRQRAMSRDALAPPAFSTISDRFGTPISAVTFTGTIMLVLIAFVPVVSLAKLASAFQLLVFVFINGALIAFRESELAQFH